MKCCWSKKKHVVSQDTDVRSEPVKPFHETFTIVAFCMSAGMLYPNPATEKFRISIILLVYALVAPVSLVIVIDVYNSWMRRDIENIIRHCTIFIPFLLVLTKNYLMFHKRVDAKKIIDEINRDHEIFNSLPRSSARDTILAEHIKTAKFGELYWLIIVLHSVFVFPLMAAAMTLYSCAFKSEPTKYMIHDVVLPSLQPEDRFKTPYFEIMFAYMLFCCLIYLLNFVGYDGFFGIAINHACFKINLCCLTLQDAMMEADTAVVYELMTGVVRAQYQIYRFVDTIQETFNFWLGSIFVGTVVHVCNCMYQIMEGIGFDVKYLIFIAGSVIHIYLPCSYASKLKTVSLDTSTRFYCCGWERVNDQRVRKMLVFMIARAQLPCTITAFNMLTFDMELFVSILHTSYSMLTLLRSRD